jgi:hypothetical protein
MRRMAPVACAAGGSPAPPFKAERAAAPAARHACVARVCLTSGTRAWQSSPLLCGRASGERARSRAAAVAPPPAAAVADPCCCAGAVAGRLMTLALAMVLGWLAAP